MYGPKSTPMVSLRISMLPAVSTRGRNPDPYEPLPKEVLAWAGRSAAARIAWSTDEPGEGTEKGLFFGKGGSSLAVSVVRCCCGTSEAGGACCAWAGGLAGG